MGRKRTLRRLATLIASITTAIGISNILRFHAFIGAEETSLETIRLPKKSWRDKQTIERHENIGVVPEDVSLSDSNTSAASISLGTQLRLPNILFVGAQKAGSSAVAKWIFDHGVCRPLIFPDEPQHYLKEVHFFDKSERFELGTKFYAKRFEHCVNQSLMMDATPSYFAYAEVVRRTYDEVGGRQAENLKILMILREPVARELSAYNHKAKRFRENGTNAVFWSDVTREDGTLMSFGEYVTQMLQSINMKDSSCKHQLNDSPEGPLAVRCYSLYVHFLRQWLRWFKPEQILVLAYDELHRDQAKLIWRLHTFLNIDMVGGEKFQTSNKQLHAHKILLPPCTIQTKLANSLNKANDDLYQLLENKTVPYMEKRPFPRFVLSDCAPGEEMR